jgi:peptidoglycan/xylan/chitin deacetylase (PgdA/CDA1 family)
VASKRALTFLTWTVELVRRVFILCVSCFALLATPANASSRSKVVSRIKTRDPVVFVTIDDGFTRSADAARELEKLNWPITHFVLPRTMGEGKTGYFVSLGSRSEFANHTVNHPNLTRLSAKQQRREICHADVKLEKLVGSHTTYFRPPGGAYDDQVLESALRCGMTHTVLWRVTVSDSTISTWGGPIRRGDIILLHYRASLGTSVRVLAKELKRLKLQPAMLSDYLS